jgi:hypothetical protein
MSMAITGTVLYLLFIQAFIIHDGEEIAMEHKWLLAHGDALCEKHPKLRRMLNHLRQMNAKAFAIAVLEELFLLVAITVYVFWGGPYAIELWAAVFMAFSIHLIIHIGQSIVVRGYVPGLVTSILLLPFSYLGMQSIRNTFSMMQLLLWGIIGMIIIAANLAVAHWLGIKMTK